MISGRRNRQESLDHNRERNLVERGIGYAKQCRLTTRFKKTASGYPGLVLFVAVRHWLQNPFATDIHTT